MDGLGGFPEDRHRRRVFGGQGIATLCNGGPVVRSLPASTSQAYGRKSSQSDIAPASVDGDAQDP